MRHTIARGETLVRIAARHGVSVSALLAANPQIDDPDLIFPGQILDLPGNGVPTPPSVYVVRSGDSLRKIGAAFGVTVAAIVAANPSLSNPDVIRPGQTLVLPAGADDSSGSTPVEVRGGSAPWLAIARREMDTGVDEVSGDAHNRRILEYHATTTLPASAAGTDETPWCSSFVNWCVEQAKLRGTDSALARSWLGWGSALAKPKVGAITVFRRFDPGNSQAGHVGFYVSAASDRVLVLGGNQSDKVCIKGYPKADLLGYRWAA